jgi:hypothetical protein
MFCLEISLKEYSRSHILTVPYLPLPNYVTLEDCAGECGTQILTKQYFPRAHGERETNRKLI